MSSDSFSSKFSRIYKALPPETQQTFLERSLAEVLDQLPPNISKKVYSSTLKLQTRYNAAPNLNFKGKRKQVSALFETLNKESKTAVFGDRAVREEILSEIISTVTDWLNDIWSVAYEHHIQFLHAHACLVYVADVLGRLDEGTGIPGCKCAVLNLSVRVTIKDKTGHTVKRLRVRGPQHVDRILFWIWRDLLLCLLAKGTKEEKEKIPDIFDDLESLYGFPGLEKLLWGGRRNIDEDEEEDEDEEFPEEDVCSDEDDDYETEDDFSCYFHSQHWSGKYADESLKLRKLIEEYLFKIFSITPSLPLYNTLVSVHSDPVDLDLRVSGILSQIAGSTSETLAAALDIHVANDNAKGIVSLLDEYSHLLRPRDAPTLQSAVAVLADSNYHARGLYILETELQDTLQAIYMGARSAFSHFEEEKNKKMLLDALKLRSGSSNRQERIERWTESVMTSSSSGPFGSMAFAAMMIGLPMMPGMAEEVDEAGDILNFIDFDGSHDPDLDDLRDEFRPRLRERFEGWTGLSVILKGGAAVTARLYVKAIELMPFLRAADVVAEMVARLSDRPSKAHVCEALQGVSSFCKNQRKRLSATRKEKERQTAAASKASGSNASSAGASSSGTNRSANAQGPTRGATAGPSPTPSPSASSSTPADSTPDLAVPTSPLLFLCPDLVGSTTSSQRTLFEGMEDVD